MTVKEYNYSFAFLKDYETVMLEHETLSQQILYYVKESRNNENNSYEKYGAVIDGESVILLFYIGVDHGLIIYSVNQVNMITASGLLAIYLGERHIIVSGITAIKEICTAFLEEYKKSVDGTFTEKIGMDIMEVRKVNDIKSAEGRQRLASIEEAKLIAEWMIDYRLEAFTSEMDYEAALKKASEYINENKVFLYENDESLIVSMAVSEHKLVHGVVITYIFTPEEYRGNGYAAVNIYYLSKKLLEQGNEFCTLLVDKKNPLSARAYEKVGYINLGEIYEYRMIPIEEYIV